MLEHLRKRREQLLEAPAIGLYGCFTWRLVGSL